MRLNPQILRIFWIFIQKTPDFWAWEKKERAMPKAPGKILPDALLSTPEPRLPKTAAGALFCLYPFKLLHVL